MSGDTNTNINIKPSTLVTALLAIVIGLLGWAFKELYTNQQESVSAADEVLAEQIERLDKRVDDTNARINKTWGKIGDLKDLVNEHRINHSR